MRSMLSASSDGYVVVIDIDNKKKNVTIDEVKSFAG
jgi:hypothetical protein